MCGYADYFISCIFNESISLTDFDGFVLIKAYSTAKQFTAYSVLDCSLYFSLVCCTAILVCLIINSNRTICRNVSCHTILVNLYIGRAICIPTNRFAINSNRLACRDCGFHFAILINANIYLSPAIVLNSLPINFNTTISRYIYTCFFIPISAINRHLYIISAGNLSASYRYRSICRYSDFAAIYRNSVIPVVNNLNAAYFNACIAIQPYVAVCNLRFAVLISSNNSTIFACCICLTSYSGSGICGQSYGIGFIIGIKNNRNIVI